jgi:hypothetical protein
MFILTPEKKAYVILGVTVSLILIISTAVIIPTILRIQKIKLEIADLRALLEERYMRIQRLHKTTLRLPQVKSYIDRWGNAFVKENTELEYVKFIEALGEQNQLDMHLTPTPFEPQKPFLKNGFKLNLQMSGTFDKISNFMQALDQADYYTIIENINLEATDKFDIAATSSPILFARLNGVIYAD